MSDDLHFTWNYVRVIVYPLLFIAQSAMIWLTVLLAITRYISVCLPYKASKLCSLHRIKSGVMSVMFCSVLYNLPRFFEVYVDSSEGSYHAIRYTALRTNYFYTHVYFDIMYYLISFIIPLLFLSFFNTKLTIAYRKLQASRASNQTSQEG